MSIVIDDHISKRTTMWGKITAPFYFCSNFVETLYRAAECRRGLAMIILSVCLSDKSVNCDKTEDKYVQIFSERELYVITRPSVCNCSLSVVCRLSSVTFVRPTHSGDWNFQQCFLRHLITWPPIVIQVRFYGDRYLTPLLQIYCRV